MPWFQTKDGKRLFFVRMPEPIRLEDVSFCAGDWAFVGADNQLRCLSHAAYLDMIKDLCPCDWNS